MQLRHFVFLLSVVLSAFLAGCGGGGGSGTQTGTVSIAVTDAPVDYAEYVWVEFGGIELQPANGDRITLLFEEKKRINLLDLHGCGLRELLVDKMEIPAGRYNWMRLILNAVADHTYDSSIIIAGEEYELDIPSQEQSGLKINTPFEVVADRELNLTIHFDLANSITAPTGQTDLMGLQIYKLRPTLRLMFDDNTGTIAGGVAATIFENQTCMPTDTLPHCAAVYIYEGVVAPDDMDDITPEPATRAWVVANPAYDATVAGSYPYVYCASYLSARDYALALTLEANLDLPESDEAITFIPTDGVNVNVSAGQATTHNFDAPP